MTYDLSNAQVLVYQPQIGKWIDNRLEFRAALAIKPDGAKEETFGVIFGTSRTQADKVLRTVTFEDMKIALDSIARSLAQSGTVDPLDGGKTAKPKPSLVNGVPTIYTSQVPTTLIVLNGQPDFVPIVGTQLLWASNTTSDALIDTGNNHYYVLMAGRWFPSAAWHRPAGNRNFVHVSSNLRGVRGL